MKKAKRESQRTPAQTGTQGLYRLVEQAQKLYKAEVSTRQKNYRRYALDFIHSTQDHDATDAWSRNEHQKNHCTIADLLTEHENLVHKYFAGETLDRNGISDLLDEFYSFDLPPSPPETTPESQTRQDSPTSKNTIEYTLDSNTLGLIVRLANEANLFKEKLQPEDVISRFASNTLQPVTSVNNTRLVLLLDRLASNGIISYTWQSVIAKKMLVISSSGKKYLDQHDMSSTLNRIKDTSPGVQEKMFFAIIDKYIMRIKSKEM